MSCPNDFYNTEFNKQYQTLYSQKAQAANTDLSRVVTSGWSLDRLLPAPTPSVESYMKMPAGGYQSISSTKYVVPTANGNKVVSEGYGCSTPTVVASPAPGSSTEYYKTSPGNTLMAAPLLPGSLVEGYVSSCPTNYLNTNFNKAYQKLYSTTC